MEKVIRFSVSLPEQLLEELDKKVSSQGYASRSEFTRDLIREKIVKDKWQNDNEVLVAVLTIVYTHNQNELLNKIMEIQHNSKITILCTTHIHLEDDNCLETIIVKGKVGKIENFTQNIGGLKGVKFSKLTRAAIPVS